LIFNYFKQYRSTSTEWILIWMSWDWVWVGRIRAWILPHVPKSIYIYYKINKNLYHLVSCDPIRPGSTLVHIIGPEADQSLHSIFLVWTSNHVLLVQVKSRSWSGSWSVWCRKWFNFYCSYSL